MAKSRQENFIFLIIDNNKNIAYTNLEHTMNTDTVEEIKMLLIKIEFIGVMKIKM